MRNSNATLDRDATQGGATCRAPTNDGARPPTLPWIALATLVLLTVAGVVVLSRSVPEHPQVALGLGIGPAVLLLAVAYPQWVVLSLVAMIPLDVVAKMVDSEAIFTLFKVLFPLAIGGLLLGRFSGRFGSLSPHPLDRWVFLFVAFQALLIPIAYDPFAALDQVRRVVSLALMYYVTSRLFADGRWNRRLVRGIVYASAVSVVFSLITYLSGSNPVADDIFVKEASRARGAAEVSPNVYGLLMLPPLFLTLARAMDSPSRLERLFQPVLALMFLTGIALSFSRSALVVLVICSAVMFWLWGNRLRSGHWVALLIVLAVGLALVPGELWERIDTLFEAAGGNIDYSIWRRFNYLEVALNIYTDHPLLGAGPGNFRVLHALPAYQTESSLIGIPRPPHNVYVQTLCEEGPLGLAMYLTILYVAMRTALTHWQRSDSSPNPEWQAGALFLSLTAFAVMGMFSHILFEKLFWVLLAMARVLPSGRS